MSGNQVKVISIRYEFNANDLFGLIGGDASEYDIEESAKKYRDLCETKLKQVYPDTNDIQVVYSSVLSGSEKLLVTVSEDSQEVDSSTEIEVIEELCQRTLGEFNWLLQKTFVSIDKSLVYCLMPPPIVRWACTNGLIKEADKSSGQWKVPPAAFPRLIEHIKFCEYESTARVIEHEMQILACYLEDVKDLAIANMPEKIRILVVSRNGFGIPLLKPNTAIIYLVRNDTQATIHIEHFVDVEGWSDTQWPYRRYALALTNQAIRKGIGNKCQIWERNSYEVIDGVTFQFTETLETNTSFQSLFEKILHEMSELVDSARMELTDGPIWDKQNDEIYRKDEHTFCTEVLLPLLKKMFKDARYTHGTKEYGRDFFLEYQTSFGQSIYFGLQAKTGDIRGTANSTITTILEQIARAFENPIRKEPESSEIKVYISIMIIAISGEFKEDALQIIRSKMPKFHFPIGSVLFWDKSKIQSLISLYWGRSKE